MEPAITESAPAPRDTRVRDAWSLFWADSQTHCAAGAPEIWRALDGFWRKFAATLPPAARVLDLGCGAGVLAKLLRAARPDLRIVGVDSATVPPSTAANVELLSGTSMESLPFPAGAFAAVVSQFGFEYGRRDEIAGEVARVLVPGGRLGFVVHHAGSAIVADTRARLDALRRFLDPATRTAFSAGDAAALRARMDAIAVAHPDDPLVLQLRHAVGTRIRWAQPQRLEAWKALAQALEPERWVSESLMAACVAASDVQAWLESLRRHLTIGCHELREADGTPLAWIVQDGEA